MRKLFLGIDPSTAGTGWAVMDEDMNLMEYGKISPLKDLSIAEKIKVIYDSLSDVFDRYEISYALCEDQFQGGNVDTLKKLSQNKGAIMLLITQRGVLFEEKAPSSWRKIYLGSGKATKKDCVNHVNEVYGLKLKFVQNDIAEAIGIAGAAVMLYQSKSLEG